MVERGAPLRVSYENPVSTRLDAADNLRQAGDIRRQRRLQQQPSAAAEMKLLELDIVDLERTAERDFRSGPKLQRDPLSVELHL